MFTKRFNVVAILSFIFIAGLTVALLLSGPRIRKADYDLSQLTQHNNQTIVLRANQPINSVDPSQISITPSADFSVNTTGDNIIIQLKERLKFDTTYSVTAKDITNAKHQKSNYQTSFTTPALEYFYLTRGNQESDSMKNPDTIIDSRTQKSIYQNEYIFDYDAIGSSLAIVTGQNRDNKLILFDISSMKEQPIALPASGTVDNLRTSLNNKLLGFTFRSNEKGTNKAFDDTLFIYDTEAKILVQPKGINDKPMSVGDWAFAPDGTSIVAQTYDTGMIIADTTSANKPIPLGTYSTLRNFSGDGKKLSLTAATGSVIIDISDNSKAPVSAAARDNIIPYVSSVHLLQNSNRTVRALYLYNAETNFSHTIIDIGSNDTFNTLVDLDENKTSLIDYTVSNNDQFIAYEAHTVADRQEYDEYNTGSRPLGTYTTIIDTGNGAELETIQGFNIVWKRN